LQTCDRANRLCNEEGYKGSNIPNASNVDRNYSKPTETNNTIMIVDCVGLYIVIACVKNQKMCPINIQKSRMFEILSLHDDSHGRHLHGGGGSKTSYRLLIGTPQRL